MRIAIGADHGGFPLNERVIEELRAAGHEVKDFGTHDGSRPDDYPDYAEAVAGVVQSGDVEIGILICGSGVGAAVAANKFRGVRAALCSDTYSAHQSREHDDCNVLCLGARVVGVELALEIVRAFVAARFTGEERHRRRLAKVAAIERLETTLSDDESNAEKRKVKKTMEEQQHPEVEESPVEKLRDDKQPGAQTPGMQKVEGDEVKKEQKPNTE